MGRVFEHLPRKKGCMCTCQLGIIEILPAMLEGYAFNILPLMVIRNLSEVDTVCPHVHIIPNHQHQQAHGNVRPSHKPPVVFVQGRDVNVRQTALQPAKRLRADNRCPHSIVVGLNWALHSVSGVGVQPVIQLVRVPHVVPERRPGNPDVGRGQLDRVVPVGGPYIVLQVDQPITAGLFCGLEPPTKPRGYVHAILIRAHPIRRTEGRLLLPLGIYLRAGLIRSDESHVVLLRQFAVVKAAVGHEENVFVGIEEPCPFNHLGRGVDFGTRGHPEPDPRSVINHRLFEHVEIHVGATHAGAPRAETGSAPDRHRSRNERVDLPRCTLVVGARQDKVILPTGLHVNVVNALVEA
mmetsp:Transcript_104436/g.179966  ORF Transcript_104436/g.179966 Transcript_104436/m.179966 type:complete len:352 (+) Transcript_104436:1075-2130(+)